MAERQSRRDGSERPLHVSERQSGDDQRDRRNAFVDRRLSRQAQPHRSGRIDRYAEFHAGYRESADAVADAVSRDCGRHQRGYLSTAGAGHLTQLDLYGARIRDPDSGHGPRDRSERGYPGGAFAGFFEPGGRDAAAGADGRHRDEGPRSYWPGEAARGAEDEHPGAIQAVRHALHESAAAGQSRYVQPAGPRRAAAGQTGRDGCAILDDRGISIAAWRDRFQPPGLRAAGRASESGRTLYTGRAGIRFSGPHSYGFAAAQDGGVALGVAGATGGGAVLSPGRRRGGHPGADQRHPVGAGIRREAVESHYFGATAVWALID